MELIGGAKVSVAVVVETDPRSLLLPEKSVFVPHGATFDELARIIESRLTRRPNGPYAHARRVFVTGLFPGGADRVGHVAAASALMGTERLFELGAIKSLPSRVVALVVVPKIGAEQFEKCVPFYRFAPTSAKQLDKFMRATLGAKRTLPSPTKPSTKVKMFIREFYPHLAKKVLGAKSTNFVITGTPGVGKTTFLWYLFRELRCAGRVVVFDCGGFFLLAQADGSILRGKRNASFRVFLNDPATIYLCDATPKRRPLGVGVVLAKTIVAVSPNPSLIQQFVKEAQPKMLFMPLWSLEELQECRKKCFKRIKGATVQVLYARFGGTARDTLVREKRLVTKLEEFTSAMNALTDDAIVTNFDFIGKVGVIDTKDGVICHRIVHLRTSSNKAGEYDYGRVKFVPASPCACRELVVRNREVPTKEICRFLRGSAGQPSVATVRGILGELWGHDKLGEGGCFPIRELRESPDDGEKGNLILEEASSVRFF